MYTITSDTIGDAHEKVVRLILQGKDFNDILTEDKEQTLEYPEPVNIHINTPFKDPMTSPKLMFGKQAMDAYTHEILNSRPLIDKPGKPDFSYLYSNLIWDYPFGRFSEFQDGTPYPTCYGKDKLPERMMWQHGNGVGNGLNQIGYIVEKLVKNPTSRRAVATLFVPMEHEFMDDPPCLNHIQFLLRNGELNMHALFRSNDMLSAWGANAYALAHLQREVLVRINGKRVNDAWTSKDKELFKDVPLATIGWMETTSISAHIYFKRDHSEAEKFRGFY